MSAVGFTGTVACWCCWSQTSSSCQSQYRSSTTITAHAGSSSTVCLTQYSCSTCSSTFAQAIIILLHSGKKNYWTDSQFIPPDATQLNRRVGRCELAIRRPHRQAWSKSDLSIFVSSCTAVEKLNRLWSWYICCYSYACLDIAWSVCRCVCLSVCLSVCVLVTHGQDVQKRLNRSRWCLGNILRAVGTMHQPAWSRWGT